MMKLNNLKDLKGVMKDLSSDGGKKAPASALPIKKARKSPTPKVHSVHGTLAIGQKVRMMESADIGVILSYKSGMYEIELDGLPVLLRADEFYPVNEDEDRRLRSSIPSSHRKKEEAEPMPSVYDNADVTVDLHLEQIPGSEGVPEWAALDFQMEYFRSVLRRNLKHRGKKIVFVHGVGDGTLAASIRRELDEVYALRCTYTVGTPGVTNVTIR